MMKFEGRLGPEVALWVLEVQAQVRSDKGRSEGRMGQGQRATSVKGPADTVTLFTMSSFAFVFKLTNSKGN